MLECFSGVHKVISLSQRAFNMEVGGGKDTRFHIKYKATQALTIVALMLCTSLCGLPLLIKLLVYSLVNWHSHMYCLLIFFSVFVTM